MSSQLPSEQVECGSSRESEDDQGTVPYILRCEEGFLSVSPAFDCDVAAILCLNFIGTSTARQFSDHVESCSYPTSDTFQNKCVLIPTVANIQELEGGDGQVEEELEELLQRGIKWTFNPPAASHHGEVWKRLICSIRKILNSTLQNLDEERLYMVLFEVEAVLNSRLISKASTNSNDLEPLTSSHLLLLKT